MKPAEIEQLFTELQFERDVRNAPDERRRGQFRTGWEDAALRRKKYSEWILRELTWRNLGYRFGEFKGALVSEQIDKVYDVLAQGYATLWVPRSREDHLLLAYWKKVSGRIYVEVPVGGPGSRWRGRNTQRRIDGIRIGASRSGGAIIRFSSSEFKECIRSQSVELIEVKTYLNRSVIGQIIAGRDMFERVYRVPVSRSLALCEESDSALEWVCQKHKISVEVVQIRRKGKCK